MALTQQTRLDRKIQQLRAVAELGQFALAEPGLDRLLDETVRRIGDALGVEFVGVLELEEDGRRLRLRAGTGWKPELAGLAVEAVGLDTQPGYTLVAGGPVVVADLAAEPRFTSPSFLHDHGVVSGLSCIIEGADGQAFGVLGAHSRQRRRFNADDADFLRSVANLIAGAVRRERTDEALRRSERHLRRVIDMMPALISYVGQDGRFEFVNARFEEWFARPLSDIEHESLLDMLDESDAAVVRRERSVVLEGRPHVWQGELSFPTGGRRPVEVRYTPDIDDEGKVQGFFSLVIDLTERRRAEAALAESERRLSSIAANFPGAIYRRVLHRDGTVSYPYISEGVRELIGTDEIETRVPLEELYANYLEPEDAVRWRGALEDSARALSRFDMEGRFTRPDGTTRWLRSSAQPHRAPSGDVIWDGVVIDITEHKQAERRLEAALHAREILLREVYHRVKNNLQVIVSLLNLQATHIHDEEARRRFVETCNRVQTLGLIHRFLYGSEDMVHIDFGQYVQELATHLYASYGVEGDRMGLELRIEPLPLELDRAVPLGLILCELISNSLKFALTDGAPGAIRIELRRLDGDAELTYGDTGPGLPADLPARRGALGLSIVRALVMQLSGRMEREPGEGGRTTIVFPLPKPRAPLDEPAPQIPV